MSKPEFDTEGRRITDVEAATEALTNRALALSGPRKTEYAGITTSGLGPLLYAVVDALEELHSRQKSRS